MTRNRLYLSQILDALNKIEAYVTVGRETFLVTSHWQDAVIRQLEIVGEATKRISPDLCAKHPKQNEKEWNATASAG